MKIGPPLRPGALIGAWALLALAAGCPPPKDPPQLGACLDAEALTLIASPEKARVNTAIQLNARGGSGSYRYVVETGGSGGKVSGDRFIAGPTPGTDTVRVEDPICELQADVKVPVVAAFDVAPAFATVRPATAFDIEVHGLLGTPVFALAQNQSGGALSAAGHYTAGATGGLDLIRVSDGLTGDVAVLQFTVSASAALRAVPARLALPAGSVAPLVTQDGSGVVTWRVTAGNGMVDGAVLSVPSGATGVVTVVGEDRFTKETVTVSTRVLDELIRPTRPHGRLGDYAAVATADFDGDGVADVAVGQPDSDLAKPAGGAVFIYKGASTGGLPAQPTWVLSGATETANFGAVLATGDLDGDGKADLAVGAPGTDLTFADSGAIYLYRFPPTGPVLIRPAMTGLGRGNFGTALAIADADGDEDMDILVGSPGNDLAPSGSLVRRGVIDLFLLEKGKPIPDNAQQRLGGWDLATDGLLRATGQVAFGRWLATADFNGDGRLDVASLGVVNNSRINGTALARNQPAIAIHLGRGTVPPFEATPDAYVLPTNTADGAEGGYRISASPSLDGKPPKLVVAVDRADSPNLTTSGGSAAASDAGGVYLFDLSTLTVGATPPTSPTQFGLVHAFARFFGNGAGVNAGRAVAFADVDASKPGPEILLGEPYAGGGAAGTLRIGGRVLVYPTAGVTAGGAFNKPPAQLFGANASDVFGVGLAAWPRTGATGLVVVAGRASGGELQFTGRLDAYVGGGDVATWTPASGSLFPAVPSSDLYGTAVAAARSGAGASVALVGAPGFSGVGSFNDGNDVAAGQALRFDIGSPRAPAMAAQGATSPILDGGRTLGTDVSATDFDGDGIQDLVVGAQLSQVPSSGSAATEITPYYAVQNAGCITSGVQSVGGVQILRGRPDGGYEQAYRLWAPAAVANCPTDAGVACGRSAIGKFVAGGFDFNGDGMGDVVASRNGGVDVFTGRPPDGAAPLLTMGCNPLYSSTMSNGLTTTTSPMALGDLDGDGCAEIGYHYEGTNRSGLTLVYGFDPGGTRCGGKTGPRVLRLSGDVETGNGNLGLGLAAANAGAFLGDGKKYLAVSSTAFPVAGRVQDAVLLYDLAQINARRPTAVGAEVVAGAIGDGLVPIPVTAPDRQPGFGRVIIGGFDLDADGRPELVVGAPNASVLGDGNGAVYVLKGSPGASGPLVPFLVVPGDIGERGLFGQSVSVAPAGGGKPPFLVIGAPNSYRTGTKNGTAFALPLAF